MTHRLNGAVVEGDEARPVKRAKKTPPALPAQGRPRRRPGLRANQRLALVVGGVSCFVLLLSVWECTAALAALTGMPLFLSFLLAFGIDAGMVVSEVVAVVEGVGPEGRRWAGRYVGLAVALSVVLNAVAAASHAEGAWKVAGAGVGAMVPALVYIGGRVAGNAWAGR